MKKKHDYTMFRLVALVLLAVFSVACHHETKEKSPMKPVEKPAGMHEGATGKALSVGTVLDIAKDHMGVQVNVSGQFMGWQGDCAGSPPVTRSDWMLSSGGKCIYVTGPVPGNLKPESGSGDIEKQIALKAVIKSTAGGQVYLVNQ